MSALDNRIAAQYRKLAALEDRIGHLMSKRVDEEEKLAELLGQRNLRDGVRPPADHLAIQPSRFVNLISVAEESDL